MDSLNTRKIMSTAGAVAVTAAHNAVTTPDADAASTAADSRTKVVAVLGHDAWHNGVALELAIRSIFKALDWSIVVVRSSSAFSPDLLKDADLLITSKASVPDHIELGSGMLADSAVEGEQFWTEENVDAIIDNVRNRGMGFMPLHCSVWTRSRVMFDFLGVEPIMHKQIQPLWVHDFDPEHPITKGIGKFMINLDEQFAVVIRSQYTKSLFQTTGIHDKRQAVGGWSLENGKGRIVGLLPGHLPDPYNTHEYREIVWRAAHWAMKRDIPPYEKG